MKFSLSILVATVIASSALYAQEVEKPRRFKFIDYTAPASQEEVIAASEVVVRVRIQGRAPIDKARAAGAPLAGVLHVGSVLDVIKGTGLVKVGNSIQIQQAAGTYEEDGYVVEIRGDQPFEPRTEYVLFLTKAGNAYREVRGPQARLQMTGRGVLARGVFGKLYTGTANDAAIGQLRAAVR